MRTKRRIQPYVTVATHEKLRGFSGVTGLAESFIVEAALQDFMGRDELDRELVVRRLDRSTAEVGRLRHDIDVLAESFAVFVRAWFVNTTPPGDMAAAKRRAESTYRQFVAHVGSRLTQSPTFVDDVDLAARQNHVSVDSDPA